MKMLISLLMMTDSLIRFIKNFLYNDEITISKRILETVKTLDYQYDM